MSEASEYISINKALWDAKTIVHKDSEFYDLPSFKAGKNTLNSIEMGLLGDVAQKSVLHLQCHFGQDTMSFSRLGAVATGIDLSSNAIELAKALSTELQLNTQFIETDVYSVPEKVVGEFDLVFSSYGTIGWLPDLNKWANVIASKLKHGGEFVFAEFHPVVWMFDYDFKFIEYSYFNVTPIIEMTEGTYAEKSAPLKNNSVSWNHPLADVLTALINAGLQITHFKEFDFSPYNCFNGMVEIEPGKFQVKGLEGKFPLVYALKATKI